MFVISVYVENSLLGIWKSPVSEINILNKRFLGLMKVEVTEFRL